MNSVEGPGIEVPAIQPYFLKSTHFGFDPQAFVPQTFDALLYLLKILRS